MNPLNEFKIKNTKGIDINICQGINIENPKGIIIMLHGIGGHFQVICDGTDCYPFKSNLFSKSNYKTYGLEFSGHGKSDGLRCSIDSYEDLIDEIRTLILYLKNIYTTQKFFIYAESMGAGLSIVYQMKYKEESFIDGFILMAPMIGFSDEIKPSSFVLNTLLFLSKIIPTVPFLGTTSHISNVCKNEKFTEARLNCSYQYNDKMRLNTVRECYLISEYIKDNLEHFTLPLFVLHSVDDTVTDPYKTIEFYRQHPNEKKKIYLTHDANHILTLGNDDNDGDI